MKVIDNGVQRDSTDIIAADRLIKLKATSSVWEVIAECLKMWSEKRPRQWNSYLVRVDTIRQTRKDPKFASVHDKKNDGYLRYTLDFPEPLLRMIRCLYSPEELPMDTRFFEVFARKFPVYKVAQKR